MGQQNGWGEEGRIAEIAEEGQEVEEKMEVGAEENGGGRFEDGGAEQQEKEMVQKAAALLARIPSLFSDFCEPCSALLLSRLSDLASGTPLSRFRFHFAGWAALWGFRVEFCDGREHLDIVTSLSSMDMEIFSPLTLSLADTAISLSLCGGGCYSNWT